MNSVYPLTQFEVRFTHLLNFNEVIREIVSPYLRIADSFNVSNQGRFEESIKINFVNEGYSIDCRWDRVVFFFENDPGRFSNPNSTMKVFWEILENLAGASSFGALRQCLFLCHEIKIINLPQDEILRKIKSKYFTGEIEKIMHDSNDVAVVLEKTVANKQSTITFGPYSAVDDKKHNLFPFSRSQSGEREAQYGTLLTFQASQEFTKVDLAVFKQLIDDQKKYSSKFSI